MGAPGGVLAVRWFLGMGSILLSLIFSILAALPAFALGDEVVPVSLDARGASRAARASSSGGLPRSRERAVPRGADVSRSLYADLIARIAAEEQVDPALIRAIITVESNYDPLAISRKGAQGLMQLMPGTADRYAVRDPFDPEANIRGGVRYLRFLQETFPGRLPLVLAAYNAGENAVLRYDGIPPYRETQQYVDRVLGHYGASNSTTTRPAPSNGDTPDAATPPPSPGIFRVVDAHGDLTYTNVRPTPPPRP
jgi:soluble lytic murein transglycosylase-like protein